MQPSRAGHIGRRVAQMRAFKYLRPRSGPFPLSVRSTPLIEASCKKYNPLLDHGYSAPFPYLLPPAALFILHPSEFILLFVPTQLR
jgi:hypothetical protein